MENVAELQKHLIFHDFVEALEEHGYEVTKAVGRTLRTAPRPEGVSY